MICRFFTFHHSDASSSPRVIVLFRFSFSLCVAQGSVVLFFSSFFMAFSLSFVSSLLCQFHFSFPSHLSHTSSVSAALISRVEGVEISPALRRAAEIAADFEACAVEHLLQRLEAVIRQEISKHSPMSEREGNMQANGENEEAFAGKRKTERPTEGNEEKMNGERRKFQIVLCGGVAGNTYLRSGVQDLISRLNQSFSAERIQTRREEEGLELELMLAAQPYCGDNGVNIAWAGIQRLRATNGRGIASERPTVLPSWPVGARDRGQLEM